MTYSTLSALFEHQVPALEDLRIDSYSHYSEWWEDVEAPSIRSLCITQIDDHGGQSPFGSIILKHPDSLKHLCLGAEAVALKRYHDPDAFSETGVDSVVQDMVDVVERESDSHQRGGTTDGDDRNVRRTTEGVSAKNPWLQLESSKLVGLDASMLMAPRFSLLDVRSLASLTLESCWGIESYLRSFRIEGIGF